MDRLAKGAKRDEHGRFLPGTQPGPGNPYAKRVGQLRSALLNAVSENDMREIIEALVAKAKEGDIAAARTLFDRVLGKPVEGDLIERIEALEARYGTQ